MKFVLPFIFVFAFVLSAYPQSNAPGTEAAITEFDVNGLKVIFKRRSSSPTVSTGLFFRGGARNETMDNAGVESLTLDAATEGSKKFPRDVLRKELARTGTAVGSASSYDYSAISMVSTSELFNRSWEILTDLVLNPSFAPEDVEREKNAMIAGLRNESASPDSALDALEEKIIFSGHPY